MAEWASPIVPVIKSDKKSVRICGDFKQTVNPVAKLDKYPIPKVEDLFVKIDLSQAYLQVPLDEESMKYVVINTHKAYSSTHDCHLVFQQPRVFFNG